MAKIAFLGASVTAQKFHHQTGERTGFVEAFKDAHARRLGFSEVVTHAWSGNRLSDAGMVCIHQMLADKPQVAVLEPMVEDTSRGRDYTDRHLEFFFQSCINARILPIALAIPKPRGSDPFGCRNFELLTNYCAPRNLPIIPVVIPPEVERDSLYRDSAHTNPLGAEFYADTLASALPGILGRGWHDIDASPRTPSYLVTEIPSAETDEVQSIRIRNLSPRPDTGPLLVLQKQKIGPYSPVITVTTDWLSAAPSRYDFSIWDPYCHYERPSYVKVAETDRGGFTTIHLNVSDALPAYETCRSDFDFSKARLTRFMRPLGSFWLISDHPMELEIEIV